MNWTLQQLPILTLATPSPSYSFTGWKPVASKVEVPLPPPGGISRAEKEDLSSQKKIQDIGVFIWDYWFVILWKGIFFLEKLGSLSKHGDIHAILLPTSSVAVAVAVRVTVIVPAAVAVVVVVLVLVIAIIIITYLGPLSGWNFRLNGKISLRSFRAKKTFSGKNPNSGKKQQICSNLRILKVIG